MISPISKYEPGMLPREPLDKRVTWVNELLEMWTPADPKVLHQIHSYARSVHSILHS
jgi:hypothetical protein